MYSLSYGFLCPFLGYEESRGFITLLSYFDQEFLFMKVVNFEQTKLDI